jgi:DNA-nicking Smr family endonuclease
MKRPVRSLTPDEAALWRRLAETVRPLRGRAKVPPSPSGEGSGAGTVERRTVHPTHPNPTLPLKGRSYESRPLDRTTLDAAWDRRLGKGVVQPDFTLDLHGHTLASAHARLDHGLTQALAQGARVLLLITGKPRTDNEITARGERRGAIRAKVLDWLAAGPHASRIAAVRPAHPRHGGTGALYVVLKRAR